MFSFSPKKVTVFSFLWNKVKKHKMKPLVQLIKLFILSQNSLTQSSNTVYIRDIRQLKSMGLCKRFRRIDIGLFSHH